MWAGLYWPDSAPWCATCRAGSRGECECTETCVVCHVESGVRWMDGGVCLECQEELQVVKDYAEFMGGGDE